MNKAKITVTVAALLAFVCLIPLSSQSTIVKLSDQPVLSKLLQTSVKQAISQEINAFYTNADNSNKAKADNLPVATTLATLLGDSTTLEFLLNQENISLHTFVNPFSILTSLITSEEEVQKILSRELTDPTQASSLVGYYVTQLILVFLDLAGEQRFLGTLLYYVQSFLNSLEDSENTAYLLGKYYNALEIFIQARGVHDWQQIMVPLGCILPLIAAILQHNETMKVLLKRQELHEKTPVDTVNEATQNYAELISATFNSETKAKEIIALATQFLLLAACPHISALIGNDEIVTMILEQMAPSEPSIKALYTLVKENLLEQASGLGHTGIVAALLKHGACVNGNSPSTCNPHDNSVPLNAAYQHRRISTIELLLKKGANPNTSLYEWHNLPILADAIKNNQLEIVNLLLKYGANPNQKTEQKTLLYEATQKSDKRYMKALITHGADINSQNESKGWTPLLWAISHNDIPAVNVLLQAGADVHITSKEKPPQTVLDLAQRNKKILQLLQDHEKPTVINTKFKTEIL